jgi:hypothetical protein
MDVLILTLATVCGMYGAPLVCVAVAALMLTALSSKRKLEIVRGYQSAATARAFAMTLVLSFANNLIFALLSFGLGRAVSLLV